MTLLLTICGAVGVAEGFTGCADLGAAFGASVDSDGCTEFGTDGCGDGKENCVGGVRFTGCADFGTAFGAGVDCDGCAAFGVDGCSAGATNCVGWVSTWADD